jgi:hypothetical protein
MIAIAESPEYVSGARSVACNARCIAAQDADRRPDRQNENS